MTSARSIAALLVAPATVVAFDPHGLVPAGPLRFGVALSLMLIVAATATEVATPLPRLVRYAGVGLASTIGVAAALGDDRWHGLIGTPDRRFGLLTWVVTVGAFSVGARLRDQRIALQRGGTFAALIIGVVGVLEAGGVTPSGSATAGGRWSGLFGQPAYLGTAAAFFGLVAAAQALEDASVDARRATNRVWRAAGILGATGCTFALAGSGTRGAIVGAAGGLVVAAGLRPQRPAVRLIAAGLGAGAVALTVWLTARRDITRFDEWAIGWRGFTRQPVLGYGPEGYRIAFGHSVTEEYNQAYGSTAFTDRAHQGVLDLALVGGVAAVLCLMVGVVLVSTIVWRHRLALTPPDLFLLAALVSHAIGQQVLFPIAWLEPIVWLYGGALIGSLGAAGTATRQSKRPQYPRIAAAGLVLVAALALSSALAETLAERRLKAEAATNLIDREVVLDAVELRPDSIRVRYAAAQLLSQNESIFDLDEALNQLEAAQGWSHHDPAVQRRYVELLNLRARRSEIPADASVAWQAAQTLVASQPRDPRSLWAAAEAARRVGETSLAAALEETAAANGQQNSAD